MEGLGHSAGWQGTACLRAMLLMNLQRDQASAEGMTKTNCISLSIRCGRPLAAAGRTARTVPFDRLRNA